MTTESTPTGTAEHEGLCSFCRRPKTNTQHTPPVCNNIYICRDMLMARTQAAERERDDYRDGAAAEARRCDELLAERNRARNETLAALERVANLEREKSKARPDGDRETKHDNDS